LAEILERQFPTLSLKGEKYAIPVGRVLEVPTSAKIRKLPRTTPYLKGLVDLRGKGVLVMDLALRIGLQKTQVADDTAIVVVEMAGDEGASVVGLIADAVHEVVETTPNLVEARSPNEGEAIGA
jgi:purine-binding chemotaxis protein CheW